MYETDFEKLGLEDWLHVSCLDRLGSVLHSSEFGKTSDGTWYWANPSRQEQNRNPQITLWSKNFIESRDEWMLRGAFHSSIRSDIYSEENLIDCFRDFLIQGWREWDYFGLQTKLTQEKFRFEEHAVEGFGSVLNWRFEWSSAEKRDLADELGDFQPSELFEVQDTDLNELGNK